jgi:hypothetical protein
MTKENDKNNNNEKIDKNEKDLTKLLKDFINDILMTFPELNEGLDENLQNIKNDNNVEMSIVKVKEYCLTVYPERFFDILYQNVEIFDNDELNLEFLPGINFKKLWKEELSDKTRETIWKYLQLILFSIVSDMSSGDNFKDTAKLFEAINQDELKSKLEETMEGMKGMFEGGSVGDASMGDLPNAEDIHEHVNKMMDGKLGNLAKEIAEETAKELNLDDIESTSDLFQTLFKNPTKLMKLIKDVGGKLDAKLKSGDIKESELLEEASEIMKNMKNMPGMGNFQEMFGKMGMPTGAKPNMAAMQAQLNRNLKVAKQKERMQAKLGHNQIISKNNESISSDELIKQQMLADKAAMELLKMEGISEEGMKELKFSTGEKVEKSSANDKNKKKKKKKNKNK